MARMKLLQWIALGFDVAELVSDRVAKLKRARAVAVALTDADVQRQVRAAHAASPNRCAAVSGLTGKPCELAAGHASRHLSGVGWFDTDVAAPLRPPAKAPVGPPRCPEICQSGSGVAKMCEQEWGHEGDHFVHVGAGLDRMQFLWDDDDPNKVKCKPTPEPEGGA